MSGRLLVLLTATAAVLATQVVGVPAAEARPGVPTMRDTRVIMAADEVLTVDVLGVDDPAVGLPFDRSRTCFPESGGLCRTSVTRDGFTTLANDDGTLTTYRESAGGGSLQLYYAAQFGTGYATARLLVTAQPSTAPRAADPDPAVRARLRVTPWARFFSFDHAGQRVSFTSVVRNTGNVALAGLAVTNASPRLSAQTCAPVPVGGTLAAGGSTTCTATVVVTQDLVDENVVLNNRVTASGQTVRSGVTYRAVAAALATAGPIQKPGLSMSASVDPASVATADRPVAYTAVVTNRGLVTVRNLLVRAPFPGLAALVCAPVPMGGELAPGQSTTCRATRTVPAALLGRTLKDTVRASAQTHQRTVNATSEVAVTAAGSPSTTPAPSDGPAPVAHADVVSTRPGHPVVVDVLGNDRAGSVSAPLVGTSVRLRLLSEPDLRFNAVLYGDAKTLVAPPLSSFPDGVYAGGAAFLVSGRGEVTVVPLTDAPSEPFTVGYQVADAAGRTTRSTLTLAVQR